MFPTHDERPDHQVRAFVIDRPWITRCGGRGEPGPLQHTVDHMILPKGPTEWDDSAMRVLVSTTANSGHFGPLVPFARACLAAGHELVVAAPASFAADVAATGFEHRPFADAPPELVGQTFGGGPLPCRSRSPTRSS